MSVEKAELRAAAIQEIGSRVDDLLEASNAAAQQVEGGESAALHVAELIKKLHAHVDKDIDEGVITSLKEGEMIKRWITRAVHIAEQYAGGLTRAKQAQKGHAQGITAVVQMLKNQHDQELRTREKHAAQESGEGHIPIKQRRLAEERASLAPAAPTGAPPPKPVASVPPPVSAASVPPNGSAAPRRRRRVERGPDA